MGLGVGYAEEESLLGRRSEALEEVPAKGRGQEDGSQGAGLRDGAERLGAGPGPGLLTVRRVDAEVDGHRRDALVSASHPVGLSLNLLAHLLEVGEFLALAVQELSIFCPRRRGARGSKHHNSRNPPGSHLPLGKDTPPHHTHTQNIAFFFLPPRKATSLLRIFIPAVRMGNEAQRGEAHTCGSIDQLQDQGASGDNARSSGQEVPAVSWG